MSSTATEAHDTIAHLEERLRRIQHAVYGSSTPDPSPSKNQDKSPATTSSAIARLHILERTLAQLTAQSSTVRRILDLQKSHPHIFQPDLSSDTPPPLPLPSLVALILAHTQLYTRVSANLTLLKDTVLPDPSDATKLIALKPRLDAALARQSTQLDMVIDLSLRSARVAQEWYEGGVLGMGEQWADWEERLREAEILVRRHEALRKREQDGLV